MGQHVVYATTDRSTAEGLGLPLFGLHRLRVEGGAAFSASLHAAPVGRATLSYLSFGSETELVLVAPPSFLVVVPAGRAEVRTGDQAAAATSSTAAVLAPGLPATLRCGASAAHLVVALERQPLLSLLRRLVGRSLDRPLVFDRELDLAAVASARWNAAVALLHAELSEAGSLLRAGIGVSELDVFLMTSLLYGHRSTYSAALREAGRGSDDLATRVATGFIANHLDRPLSVAAVASAAGVSARTLQAAFRAELGITPTAYIRDRRLDRVRAELADASSSAGTTVTEVAHRWGINHLGRFAVDYRARFGESPSQTLRATAGGAGCDGFLSGILG